MVASSAIAPSRADLLENYFYFLMALLIAAVVVYGFSQTVETKLFHPPQPRPFLLFVHAAVFFGWVLFFILQSALVRMRNVSWHRSIGWFGVGLAVTMFVLGISTAVTMARFNKFTLHARYPEANLLISFFDITAFAIPFALAIYWRKKPAFHRRLQLLSCSALTAAAFGRFLPLFSMPAARHNLPLFAFAIWTTLYAGVDILILIAAARDLFFDRRIHPVYLWGLPAFAACQTFVLYTVVHHSPWWLKTAEAILG
ncbi:MAG TPA: hypothetical protein VGR94_03760 [Candidatus Acidoferrales bacterium]|nr:hypothetical protein [Candidatus Acidoferrales bacterium]